MGLLGSHPAAIAVRNLWQELSFMRSTFGEGSPSPATPRFATCLGLSLIAMLTAASAVRADVLPVDPYAYPTIQSAIDAAYDGDEIVVAPGIYYEQLDFLGKDIVVRSSDGADVTFISGDGKSGTLVCFTSGEPSSATLQGFTLTDGLGYDGGAVVIDDSGATIRDCVFVYNGDIPRGGNAGTREGGNGGAIVVYYGYAELDRCDFYDNATGGSGGAVYADLSYVELRRCRLAYNYASYDGGAVAGRYSSVYLSNCELMSNFSYYDGGGVHAFAATAIVRNSTLTDNYAGYSGGGVYAFVTEGEDLTVANSISWENGAGWLGRDEIFAVPSGGTVLVTYSDVRGGFVGAGNIDADPQFRDPMYGDFRLGAGSPCIDAGQNARAAGLTVDLVGNPRFLNDPATADCAQAPGTCGTAPIVDMGAHEFCAPDRLLLWNVPGVATAGDVLMPMVVLVDQCGEWVDDPARTVTLELIIPPGGGPLSGNASRPLVGGAAQWDYADLLSITTAATGYRLRATVSGPPLATSSTVLSDLFTIVPGPINYIEFTRQPVDTIAGQDLTPAVGAFDEFGNLIPDEPRLITLELGQNPGMTTLNGNLSRLTAGGEASWSSLDHLNMTKAAAGSTLQASTFDQFRRLFLTTESAPFAILPAAPHRLIFLAQPVDTIAGQPLLPSIAVNDVFGNVVNTASFTVSLVIDSNPTSAPLSGTTSRPTASGVATWSAADAMNIAAPGIGYTLAASAVPSTIAGAISSTFRILPGALASFGVSASPDPGVVGEPVRVVLTARDALGNAIPNFQPATNIVIQVATAGSGNLTFADGPVGSVVVNGSGNSATIPAVPGQTFGPAGQADFTIENTLAEGPIAITVSDGVAMGAGQLTFLDTDTSPSQSTISAADGVAVADGSDSEPITVVLRDLFGNPLAGRDVGLSIVDSDPTGVQITAISPRTNSSGVALFNVRSTRVGTIRLRAASLGDGVATNGTALVSFVHGPPAQLVFLTQPTNNLVDTAIQPAVQVELRDAFGNRASSSNAAVTLQIDANPGGATLANGGPIAAVNGIATFPDVSFDQPGLGYTLRALSGGLTSAPSASFNIFEPPAPPPPPPPLFTSASLSTVVAADGTAIADNVDVEQVTVTLRDTFGNLMAGANVQLLLASGGAAGVTISPASTATNASGQAVFSIRGTQAQTVTLRAVNLGDGVGVTQTATIVFQPGPAAGLTFFVQPGVTVAGLNISPAVVVAIVDAQGNLVASATNAVSIALANNPSSATLTGGGGVSAVGGLATFSGLSINAPGTGYTLRASAPALATADSSPFDVLASSPPAPQPRPPFDILVDPDAQTSLLALLLRNSLCGLGAAGMIPAVLIGLASMRWRIRSRRRRSL